MYMYEYIIINDPNIFVVYSKHKYTHIKRIKQYSDVSNTSFSASAN